VTKARILAVDDQLYFRVFLEDLLRSEGFEAVAVASGAEALERLDGERFDLILTDLMMPGMDGTELVQRVKERFPEQDVLVVTSVGDVKTAVAAMKLGATDYLLKPIDRAVLLRAIGGVLDRRRMREEHARLMAENLEYMGAFTLYERALGLFANLSPEALADRIVEVLCLEASAHGGVLWLAGVEQPGRLRLAGVRGLVRVENEIEELDTNAPPPGLEAVTDPAARAFLLAPSQEEGGDGPHRAERAALVVPLRHGGRLLAVARLTDKLDGGEFGAAERELAARFIPFAAQAVANSLRFRALERRSFRDAASGAYTKDYFEDVTRNEIQKARRFGRSFALVRVALDGLDALRARRPAEAFGRWLEAVTQQLARALRSTDLVAAEREGRLCLLLPETDSLGAAVLKRRVRAALERCAEMRALAADERPTLLMGAACFPTDGIDLDGLEAALEARLADDRHSLVRGRELESAPFRGIVDALLAEARPGRPETAEQMTRLVFSEVARRPDARGLLFVAPGASLASAVQQGLDMVRGAAPRTEIVVVAERKGDPLPGVPATWVSSVRAGTPSPFLVYYGEGSCYALVRAEAIEDDRTAFFHSSDPALVEHLAFQLGRDLGIPIGE
jgi:two-component system, cell cycle response regulator